MLTGMAITMKTDNNKCLWRMWRNWKPTARLVGIKAIVKTVWCPLRKSLLKHKVTTGPSNSTPKHIPEIMRNNYSSKYIQAYNSNFHDSPKTGKSKWSALHILTSCDIIAHVKEVSVHTTKDMNPKDVLGKAMVNTRSHTTGSGLEVARAYVFVGNDRTGEVSMGYRLFGGQMLEKVVIH